MRVQPPSPVARSTSSTRGSVDDDRLDDRTGHRRAVQGRRDRRGPAECSTSRVRAAGTTATAKPGVSVPRARRSRRSRCARCGRPHARIGRAAESSHGRDGRGAAGSCEVVGAGRAWSSSTRSCAADEDRRRGGRGRRRGDVRAVTVNSRTKEEEGAGPREDVAAGEGVGAPRHTDSDRTGVTGACPNEHAHLPRLTAGGAPRSAGALSARSRAPWSCAATSRRDRPSKTRA